MLDNTSNLLGGLSICYNTVMRFNTTTHLSEITEASDKNQVVIFKHSKNCWSSNKLKTEFERKMEEKSFTMLVYIVTVQETPELSRKIAEMFDTQHETPQILVLEKGKVVYEAHHDKIDIEKFIFS
jgi:bacillithiol system protein YtxJ